VLLFILGSLLPPLAVAARFGIGVDFWLNLLLTICGYIPGHFHNFYIQNIRNNKNNKRTPKWAAKHGLIDTTALERRKKRTQWANRYNDRLPRSTLEGQSYAEGQEGGSSIDLSAEQGDRPNRTNGGDDLWRAEDEQYYGDNGGARPAESGGRWRYPANFEDTMAEPEVPKKKKKKEKKDRWERTEDAYSISETDPAPRKRKKSKRSKPSGDADTRSRQSDSINEFPEDAEGGLYGDRNAGRSVGQGTGQGPQATREEDLFSHEF